MIKVILSVIIIIASILYLSFIFTIQPDVSYYWLDVIAKKSAIERVSGSTILKNRNNMAFMMDQKNIKVRIVNGDGYTRIWFAGEDGQFEEIDKYLASDDIYLDHYEHNCSITVHNYQKYLTYSKLSIKVMISGKMYYISQYSIDGGFEKYLADLYLASLVSGD